MRLFRATFQLTFEKGPTNLNSTVSHLSLWIPGCVCLQKWPLTWSVSGTQQRMAPTRPSRVDISLQRSGLCRQARCAAQHGFFQVPPLSPTSLLREEETQATQREPNPVPLAVHICRLSSPLRATCSAVSHGYLPSCPQTPALFGSLILSSVQRPGEGGSEDTVSSSLYGEGKHTSVF